MLNLVSFLLRQKKIPATSSASGTEQSPLQIPFVVRANRVHEAREMLARRPVAELRTAYGQSLATAQQMVRDGVNRRDASGFEGLCLGLDLLGIHLPGIKAPECHSIALQPVQPRRRRPLDDGNTDPILPPQKPKRKDRGNDRD